jgi:hypothetical protein
MIFDLDLDRVGVSNLYTTSKMFQGSLPEEKKDIIDNGSGK